MVPARTPPALIYPPAHGIAPLGSTRQVAANASMEVS